MATGSGVRQFQTNPRGVGGLLSPPYTVSDVQFQTNPRGVGGALQSTAVWLQSRFRPTLVGSEGSLPRLGKSPDRRFQTNPRGVGGSTVPVCA